MNKEEAEKLFSKKYPCMYEGTIRCDDCQNHTPEKIAQDDECDMAAGRNSHMKYFVEGVMIAHIAALMQDPNQPKGTGDYYLTIKVGVYRDSRGYETVHYHNNGSNYLSAETKDITGHWQPITPDKE